MRTEKINHPQKMLKPKTHVQVQDEVNERGKVEKQSIAYPVSKDPREAYTVIINKWLSSSLKGETEGLLVAAQD